MGVVPANAVRSESECCPIDQILVVATFNRGHFAQVKGLSIVDPK
jgi:hypothetical protein